MHQNFNTTEHFPIDSVTHQYSLGWSTSRRKGKDKTKTAALRPFRVENFEHPQGKPKEKILGILGRIIRLHYGSIRIPTNLSERYVSQPCNYPSRNDNQLSSRSLIVNIIYFYNKVCRQADGQTLLSLENSPSTHQLTSQRILGSLHRIDENTKPQTTIPSPIYLAHLSPARVCLLMGHS
ncbi:hypothetical protein WAI453_008576 [Rhynchosporium graminicola]